MASESCSQTSNPGSTSSHLGAFFGVPQVGCGLCAEVCILIHASCGPQNVIPLIFSTFLCNLLLLVLCGSKLCFAIVHSVVLCILISRFYILEFRSRN
jgi:hypothetical protein